MAGRIVVLGDSSSSSIGWGQDCYPARLHAALASRGAVELWNCAVPGFTSADAARFFDREGARLAADHLIVYLGNNEGADSVRKGRFRPVKARWDAWRARPRARPFRPILSPPRFRFQHRLPPQSPATTPREFRANLRFIVHRAVRAGTRVILINPIANDRFPCGVGVPNGTYLCQLDALDALGYAVANQPTDAFSSGLDAGLAHFREGSWAEAIAAWGKLAPSDLVEGFVVRHNLACARVHLGDAGAEGDLAGLLGAVPCYDSTVLYNLAHCSLRRGDRAEAGARRALAVVKDLAVYRIGGEYRDVIASFASTKGVDVLDLREILGPDHFIDYCHPTAAGHERIAEALARRIGSDTSAIATDGGSRYEIRLPTPNYVRDPDDTLVDYYCMDWPIDADEIAVLVRARGRAGDETAAHDAPLADCIDNFFRSNAEHPIFTENVALSGSWTPRSHEILSFPEFFLYRLLSAYAAAAVPESPVRRLSVAPLREPPRFAAEDYERLILRKTAEPLETALDLREAYGRAIVEKVAHRLRTSSTIFRPAIGERIRTTTLWYTREAFRYGTSSRLSMLYPRWDIDRLIEGLAVAIVIAERRSAGRDGVADLDRLLSLMVELLGVHERHVALYHANADGFSDAAYRSDLARLQRSVLDHLDGGRA